METISVVVRGASGKMGQEVIKAVCREPGLRLVGAVDVSAAEGTLKLPDSAGAVPISADLEQILVSCQPKVVVDFTVAAAVMPAVEIACRRKVNMVVGTTGLTADNLKEIDQLAIAHKTGIVVAANFALGAVLMIHLARIAAKYLNHAEIIELHHDRKADAPSGTALATARAMAQARGRPFDHPAVESNPRESRGLRVEGAALHSVRLPGLLAHQEVIFGTAGQTLSIRHDTIGRECYIPGVLLAIKEVVNRIGLVYGLDTLLGL